MSPARRGTIQGNFANAPVLLKFGSFLWFSISIMFLNISYALGFPVFSVIVVHVLLVCVTRFLAIGKREVFVICNADTLGCDTSGRRYMGASLQLGKCSGTSKGAGIQGQQDTRYAGKSCVCVLLHFLI